MTTKTKDVIFCLPFGGFYHSEHSERVDSKIESDYEDGEFPAFEEENIDYKKTYINYSKEWLNQLNSEMDLELEFVEIDSPPYYNFTTDKIVSKISEQQFEEVKEKYLGMEEAVDWINTVSKSRDGFHSFYSGIEAVSECDEILMQYIFQYIIEVEEEVEIDVYDIEFEVELINPNL